MSPCSLLKAAPQSALPPIVNITRDAMSQGVDIRLRSTPGASPLLQVARIEGHGCVLHGCATLKRLVMDKMVIEDKQDRVKIEKQKNAGHPEFQYFRGQYYSMRTGLNISNKEYDPSASQSRPYSASASPRISDPSLILLPQTHIRHNRGHP